MRLGLASCALLAACGALVAPVRADWQCPEPTALTLSGAAWSAALDRYVLLGESADEREPTLFAVSAGGQLDPTPISMKLPADIGRLSAIAPGPNGALFVLSTGRPAGAGFHEQRLLQLELEAGGTARVSGMLDLDPAQLGDAVTPTLASAVVTGLAFQEDVLYLALAASNEGIDATILALSHAKAMLASGAVTKGALSVWSKASFCQAPGACGRVSNLAADGDGGLLVVTHSTGDAAPASSVETLWRLPRLAAAPQQLERFEGLGSARLALSSDRASAILLFGGADRQPLWLSWRLPS